MVKFIISFLATFLAGVIRYDTTHIQITDYKIKSNKINRKLKICVLSDLHNVLFERDLVYRKVNSLKPDLIIMAGDMANSKFRFSDAKAIDLLRRLAKDYPVYYGIGNHEARLLWSPDRFNVTYKRLISTLKKNGATVLDNESIYISEFGVRITGLNLPEDYYKKFFKKDTDENSLTSLIGEKKDDYEILIAHNPEYFDDYVKRGSELVFSGHLHGGIMRLPLNLGAVSPRYRLLPRFAWGMFKKRRTRMIVSRGLGQHTIPVRVFNTSEIVMVTIN